MTLTNFADHKHTYQAALLSLFHGTPEETEADLSKLFTPDFYFEANGEPRMNFLTFVSHMKRLRGMALETTLTTLQFLRDGNQLAERHTSSQRMPDGSYSQAETFMFGEVAEDGRVAWLIEAILRTSGPKPRNPSQGQ